MATLFGIMERLWDADPIVARVTNNVDLPRAVRGTYLVLPKEGCVTDGSGYAGVLNTGGTTHNPPENIIQIPEDFSHLSEGDVVWLTPRTGKIEILYRKASNCNYIFATARCNCKCICCPQPPRQLDDPDRVWAISRAIPLISREAQSLGITGGEPTLLGQGLVQIIERCRAYLPTTTLHLLSNGRNFQYMRYAEAIGKVGRPMLLIGTPLFSDIANEHDFLCQAKGAFDEAIRGVLNMHRAQLQVEIRFVLHAHASGRLLRFAKFVARNFPFVSQVSFMGLETVGYAAANRNDLWIDPLDLMPELEEAVLHLKGMNIPVALFNLQLCTLPKSLWQCAKKSISDWKNDFLPECSECYVREKCGGFFTLKTCKVSRGIMALH